MKHVFALLILFQCGLALAAPATQPAASPAKVSGEAAPKWDAMFQTTEGWIGGDCAESVQLGPRRVAWFFGDSIIGHVRDGHRVDSTMVNNTVGIQDGLTASATVKFHWGKNASGKPAAMFIPADGKGWFWPQGAAMIDGRLVLALAQIDRAKGDSGAFGFKGVGQWLAVIDNPNDDPSAWRVAQHQIPFVGGEHGMVRSWGSALLRVGDTVYVYGYDESVKGFGGRKLIVARAPADRLTDFSAWSFAAADGWSNTPSHSAPLADSMATEYTVDRMPGGKGYVLVYTESGFSDRMLGRFADDPAGPWSDAKVLYVAPEMKQDKRVFTYAAKNHPWASKDGQLLITYCQNMFELGPVFENQWVYRPRFARIRIENPPR